MMPQVTTDDAGDLKRIDPRWALLCHCVLPDHLTLEVDHVLRLQRLNVGFSREGANPLLHIEKDGKFPKARKSRSERSFSIADAARLDNQIDRARVLEVRIQSPPAKSHANHRFLSG